MRKNHFTAFCPNEVSSAVDIDFKWMHEDEGKLLIQKVIFSLSLGIFRQKSQFQTITCGKKVLAHIIIANLDILNEYFHTSWSCPSDYTHR